jgi:hypothetical protein
MGSAEFEFGALPKSLKWICANWPTYVVKRVEKIQDLDGNFLYFIAPKEMERESLFKPEVVTPEDVEKVLIRLFTEKYPYRLKEYSNCYDRIHGSPYLAGRVPDTNFWWDLNHHWMACFGKDIKRLLIALSLVLERKGRPNRVGPTIEDDLFGTPVFKIEQYKNKIIVTDFSGRNTNILLNNVKEVSEDNEKLTVIVRTRSGVDKTLYIEVLPCSRRDFVVSLLRERAAKNRLQ